MGKEKLITVKPEELQQAWSEKVRKEIFSLPPLEDNVFDLTIFTTEMAEREAKEFREKKSPKLEEDVKRALPWLDALAKADRETKEVMEFVLKQSGKKHPADWLRENLSHPIAPYRRITWTTLLKYYFSQEVKTKEEVQELLSFLCQQGYLQKDPNGPFKAFGESYALPERALVVLAGQPELSQLTRTFRELLWRVRLTEKRAAEEKGKTLLSQSTLSLDEFLGGKPGLLALEIPEKEGRRGGVLLVRTEEGKIFPIDAVGGFQKAIEEAKKLRIFLLLQSLSRNSPPFIKGMESEKGAKIALLWHLIKNGISELKTREEIEALRKEMKATANLSPEEFFLAGKAGATLAEWKGPWLWKTIVEGEVKESRLENLFFLVERQEKEGQSIIRLARIPPWLEEFFSNCQGEFKEGERFEGVPQPLKSVLRAIWGQVRKRSQIEG